MSAVVSIVRKLGASKVLDFGCGDGRLISLLQEDGQVLVGVDHSERALRLARAFNPNATFHSSIQDVNDVFDCITMVEVLEHIPDSDIPSVLRGLHQRLASDGHIVISVPTKNVPVNPKHYRHYDIELLERTLGEHWRIVYHAYFFRKSRISKMLDIIKMNELFSLHAPLLLNFEYKKRYHANKQNGIHLIVVAGKRVT